MPQSESAIEPKNHVMSSRLSGMRLVPILNLHAHFLQGLLLNLADAFAGHAQACSDLFKGFGRPLSSPKRIARIRLSRASSVARTSFTNSLSL